MALTQFEKDCIDEIYEGLTSNPHKPRTPEQLAGIDTIKHGEEADKRTLITDYINDTGLDLVADQIADCDRVITDTNTRKTDLQAKQTAMQSYVAP